MVALLLGLTISTLGLSVSGGLKITILYNIMTLKTIVPAPSSPSPDYYDYSGDYYDTTGDFSDDYYDTTGDYSGFGDYYDATGDYSGDYYDATGDYDGNVVFG